MTLDPPFLLPASVLDVGPVFHLGVSLWSSNLLILAISLTMWLSVQQAVSGPGQIWSLAH